MKNITAIITRNRIYFTGLATVLFAGCIFWLVQGRDAAFVSQYAFHPFWLNVFFINFTFMGDGIFALCLVAVLFFYFRKKQLAITLFGSFLIAGMAIQVIKNLVIAKGPALYFEAGTYLNFINDATLTNNTGFVSGHTATAFAMATVFALMMTNKKLQLLLLGGALLIGYSRMYLAQHFLTDVIIGAAIGTVSGIVAVYLAQNVLVIKSSFNKLHSIQENRPTSPSSIQTAAS